MVSVFDRASRGDDRFSSVVGNVGAGPIRALQDYAVANVGMPSDNINQLPPVVTNYEESDREASTNINLVSVFDRAIRNNGPSAGS